MVCGCGVVGTFEVVFLSGRQEILWQCNSSWGRFADLYMFHKESGYNLSSLNFALVLGETCGTNLKLGNGKRLNLSDKSAFLTCLVAKTCATNRRMGIGACPFFHLLFMWVKSLNAEYLCPCQHRIPG